MLLGNIHKLCHAPREGRESTKSGEPYTVFGKNHDKEERFKITNICVILFVNSPLSLTKLKKFDTQQTVSILCPS